MALSIASTQGSNSQAPQVPSEYAVKKYHTPRVAIIIPHYNYSELIGDALISVQQQTYSNFTCVVVDDCSTEAHYNAVAKEVTKLGDDRFKLVRNGENVGMVRSIYRGIDEIDAAFLAVLDPDDRYVPQFIARMLAVHLNPLIFCPMVSYDQYLLKIGDGRVTMQSDRLGFSCQNRSCAPNLRRLNLSSSRAVRNKSLAFEEVVDCLGNDGQVQNSNQDNKRKSSHAKSWRPHEAQSPVPLPIDLKPHKPKVVGNQRGARPDASNEQFTARMPPLIGPCAP
jgi:glycosyltransferase involved in cell wall biosynthesis